MKRVLDDQTMGSERNGVAAMVQRANVLSFDDAMEDVASKLSFLQNGMSVLYLEKPKTKSRLEIAEGSMEETIKHRLLYSTNKAFEGMIGNEVVLNEMGMIGFLGSSDLITIEDFKIAAILNK